jgi:ABC-2 type transport system permease protein
MKPFVTTMKQELLCARRERLPQVFLAVLLIMTALSCFISWATNHTVTNVYNELLRQGATTAPNPFTGVSSLYYARNTVIYIVLIGALLAIVLGVQSMLRDRKAGVIDLLLSRPLGMVTYLCAKLTGLVTWLLAALAISGFINWMSISLITGHALSGGDSARLLLFYLSAGLFLVPFVVLGLLGGVYSRRETSALIAPIVIWATMIFVLPQLGTAEHPVSLLNPVPAQIVSHGLFFQVNQTIFSPLSIGEQFKHLSSSIFQDGQTTGGLRTSLTILVGFSVVSVGILLIAKRHRMRADLYE